MRIGIVSYWFNRGQATVARWFRDTLHDLGHETFVLARPTKDTFVHPGRVDSADVWAQSGVVSASRHSIPLNEYLDWADSTGLDVVMVDQNYQFDELRALRRRGIRTIGRFVWEAFKPEHVEQAHEALEVMYSLTRAEQARYRQLGLDTPLVPFGCHPELIQYARATPRLRQDADKPVSFFYPSGFNSRRKPTGAVVEAFRRVEDPNARLTIKAQRSLQNTDLVLPKETTHERLRRRHTRELAERGMVAALDDDRVRILVDDLPVDSYYRMFAEHDVCLAPSRWEGLGLHLFEATAFGLPVVANDIPPIDEVITHGTNGWLCDSWTVGRAPSGILAYEPDVDALAAGIATMARDADRRIAAAQGARDRRDELAWQRTRSALDSLVKG